MAIDSLAADPHTVGMSPKATELINDLLMAEYGHGEDKAEQALIAYIQELERKAQAWDKCQDDQEAFVRVAALLSRKHN